MESTKGVIRVTKLAEHYNGYDEIYYFTDVAIDVDSHLMARISGNVFDAMKFIWNTPNEDEQMRINSLINFVKTCFKPSKKFKIEFVPLTIIY